MQTVQEKGEENKENTVPTSNNNNNNKGSFRLLWDRSKTT